MSFDVEGYLHYRIANVPILGYPFPHFYISEIFPPECYRELVAGLPKQEHYRRLDETGTVTKGAYPERFVCELSAARATESEAGPGRSWHEVARVLEGSTFAQCILVRFQDAIMQRFGQQVEMDIRTDCRLVRDFSNYAIAPHTDSPHKLVSLLFYMPPDDSMRELGTSIFAPNDPDFRCDGTKHHEFGDFKKIMTAAYMPNSLFGFFKTDRAFHGVEQIERPRIRRDSVLYNIYVAKVARRAGAGQA